MSCPEPELLSAIAEDRLDAVADAEVERHLAVCPVCREHVSDMRWLDALGRRSLKSVRVSVEHSPILPGTAPARWKFLRQVTWAAAAGGLILLSFAGWRINDRLGEQRQTSAPQPAPLDTLRTGRITNAEAHTSKDGVAVNGSSDEAFERWVEPYRRLRIPLVPMEELAKRNPAGPAPAKPSGAG